MSLEKFQATLAGGNPVIMDGAFGELVTARGGNTTMPLWATHELLNAEGHPIVAGIHSDYIAAGATVIETGTFRAQAETFAAHAVAAGQEGSRLSPLEAFGSSDPAALSRRAIHTAGQLAVTTRAKSGKPDIIIAGSMGPINDCYTPSATPSDRELAAAHTRYAEALAESGVGYVSVETIPTIREAVIAAKAAKEAGIPYSVSFWGDKGGGIGHDETLQDGVRALERAGLDPLYIGVNCVPIAVAGESVKTLRDSTDLPIAVSANGDGDPTQHNTWRYQHEHNLHYAEAAERWLAAGALLVGGCCGTTPTTIKGLAQLVGPTPAQQ
ncbi:MAG TPA: homocysteine S-methyltransferase family protein [Candidatus Saccharimonadales bacterium]|nr:homocysteine S-methyltransferase family protein [Candidatus Saccharimonadales bacterium]